MRDETCGVGALAVANSYGFLLKRLTFSHHLGVLLLAAFARSRAAKVSSQNQMYGKIPQMQEESSKMQSRKRGTSKYLYAWRSAHSSREPRVTSNQGRPQLAGEDYIC